MKTIDQIIEKSAIETLYSDGRSSRRQAVCKAFSPNGDDYREALVKGRMDDPTADGGYWYLAADTMRGDFISPKNAQGIAKALIEKGYTVMVQSGQHDENYRLTSKPERVVSKAEKQRQKRRRPSVAARKILWDYI